LPIRFTGSKPFRLDGIYSAIGKNRDHGLRGGKSQMR
jgi:hypothetical protein